MNIGERITQVRKENGLSQEQFGSSIHVTRQTVSKWEMNQSIPDVDKCIEISKQYNVSIEWLLGIKETKDDTNNQMNTIESIVKKNTKERWRHGLFMGFLSILCIFIGFFMHSSIRYLEMNQNTLQLNFEQLNNKVNYQNDYLNKLENLLENQNEFIINECEFINYDYQNNKATLYLNITPKEIHKDMTIEIVVDNGKETFKKQAALKENRQYTIENDIALSDNLLISANIKTSQSEYMKYVTKIENALSDTQYKSFDYEEYAYNSNQSRVTSFTLGSRYKKIENLEIQKIESYVFIDNVFYKMIPSILNIDEVMNEYTSETRIELNDYKTKIYIEVLDVVYDSCGRSYVSGGTKFSISKEGTRIQENYEVNKDFEWERYQ